MKTLSITTQHCPSYAAIWLQAARALSFGIMALQAVKFGPNTGTEDRMREVRG